MEDGSRTAGEVAATPEILATLVANHRDFLAFLESRLGSRATAEEILQSAFVRTLERGGAIRESESATAWFYRLLRNAITDHYRRTGREARALDLEAGAAEPWVDEELRTRVCRCIDFLLPAMKAEYADVIRRVDLEERPLAEVAAALGITANNTAVRLHRARQALRRELERTCRTCAEHGCLDCRCGEKPGRLREP